MNGGSRDLRRYMVVLGLSTTYGIKAKDKIDEPELMKRTKAPILLFFEREHAYEPCTFTSLP